MRLPWRRASPPPVPERAAPAPAAESRAGWAFVQPLARTVREPELTSRPMEFVASLPTRAQPMLTGAMSHVVSPAAPSGVLDGDGGRLGTPTTRSSDVDLALVAPAAPSAVRTPTPVQRRTGVLVGLDAPPPGVPELQAVPVEPATTPEGAVDTPAPTVLGPTLPAADPGPPAAPAGTAVQRSPTPGPPAGLPYSDGDATFVALPTPASVGTTPVGSSPLTRPTASPEPLPVVQRRVGLGAPLRPGRSAVTPGPAPGTARRPGPDAAPTPADAAPTSVGRTITPPGSSAAIPSVPPMGRTSPKPAVTPEPSAPSPQADLTVVSRPTSDDPPVRGAQSLADDSAVPRSLGDDTALPQVARTVVPPDDGDRATPAAPRTPVLGARPHDGAHGPSARTPATAARPVVATTPVSTRPVAGTAPVATPSAVTTSPVVARVVAGLGLDPHASVATPPPSGHADQPSPAGGPAHASVEPSASSSAATPLPSTASVPRTAGILGGPAPTTATSGVAASAPGRSSAAGTPSAPVQRTQAPVTPTPVVEGPPPPGDADTAPPVQPTPAAAVPLLQLPLSVPSPSDSPPPTTVVQRAPLLSVARSLVRATSSQPPSTLGVVPGRPPAAVPARPALDVPVVPTRPAAVAPDLSPAVLRAAHVPPTAYGGPGRASPPSTADATAAPEPTPGPLAVRPAPVQRVDAPTRVPEPARTVPRAVQDDPRQDAPRQDAPVRSTATVQTLVEGPPVPTATPPDTAAPPNAGGASPFASASAADLDELARRLTAPLLRRVRGQLLVDRERRGVRADL